MTRSLLAITALLLSLTFTVSEVPATHVVKANTLSQSAASVETACTTAGHTEKHFLPAAELTLALVHPDYVSVSLYAPAFPVVNPDLNIRGPPSTNA